VRDQGGNVLNDPAAAARQQVCEMMWTGVFFIWVGGGNKMYYRLVYLINQQHSKPSQTKTNTHHHTLSPIKKIINQHPNPTQAIKGRPAPTNPVGTRRVFRVHLDPAQYHMDATK
jgi:hypothetical protein